MSTACYDRKPEPPREPIKIAGDLVRRSDKLSIEGALCIKDLAASLKESQQRLAEVEQQLKEARELNDKLLAPNSLSKGTNHV